MIYWKTGQPGAGKTTLANALAEALKVRGERSVVIDADEWRKTTSNHDYSRDGRRQNVLSAQIYAQFLNIEGRNGTKTTDHVVCAFVSPYRDIREDFKKKTNVIEVYVHTDNVRGREHYGVSDYEPPLSDFIDIDTGVFTVDQEVSIVLSACPQI